MRPHKDVERAKLFTAIDFVRAALIASLTSINSDEVQELNYTQRMGKDFFQISDQQFELAPSELL